MVVHMADVSPLLAVDGLSKSFRGLQALDGYHLRVEPGALVGIIGPNGAGKTTIFNLLTGIVKPDQGSVHFAGTDITGQRVDRIARQGLARTFQKIRLFQPLTVLDNLRIALQAHQQVRMWDVVLGSPRFARSEQALRQEAYQLLEEVGIPDVATQPVRELSYGQQRRLEVACALALHPRLLLLDEPAAGMNPTEAEALMALLRTLHQARRLALLLIEHNMRIVMNLCPTIQVLNYGRIIAEGTPEAIRGDARVVEAYLGQPEPAL